MPNMLLCAVGTTWFCVLHELHAMQFMEYTKLSLTVHSKLLCTVNNSTARNG